MSHDNIKKNPWADINEKARKHLESAEFAAEKVAAMSKEPFGQELAMKVAARLRKGPILRVHRDYCGHGLSYDAETGEFLLSSVIDGHLFSTLLSWPNELDFINFLAAQSDYSLCGADPALPQIYSDQHFFHCNQTLTRSFLEQATCRTNEWV